MEYNTNREKIVISEYGRNIQMMIRHLLEIEDRKQRTEAAYFIVSVMAQMNPQVKESNDYMHKLWDHLYIISEYKLDVDGPYEKPTPEMQKKKPEHVGYQKNNIRYGHYGQYIYDVVKKVKEMEDGPKKQAILVNIANHMKRDYLNWNRDTVNDLLILDDLYKISGEDPGHLVTDMEVSADGISIRAEGSSFDARILLLYQGDNKIETDVSIGQDVTFITFDGNNWNFSK